MEGAPRSDSDFVKVYDSQSEDYRKAFKAFLDQTDQNVNMREWPKQCMQWSTISNQVCSQPFSIPA